MRANSTESRCLGAVTAVSKDFVQNLGPGRPSCTEVITPFAHTTPKEASQAGEEKTNCSSEGAVIAFTEILIT